MNPLKQLLTERGNSNLKGIVSLCTANALVIEAAMEHLLSSELPLLIEATANQVNQYGGYTNMTPADYRDFVLGLCEKTKFPTKRLILGGDHLGPLTWVKLPVEEAMTRSEELVRQFVMAGFTKIHLDTSMRLSCDDPSKPLSTDVIAQRGIRLMKVAEQAYRDLKQHDPKAIAPVYIVGSEVPIPGGAQEEESISVTKPDDFRHTVDVYRDLMKEEGLGDVWDRIVAVVVQPGVEFGDDSVHHYDPIAAKQLVQSLREYQGIVFEGHSTDYQTKTSLKAMVEDGIAILKVGPALTFYLREGLFALSMIEDELIDAGLRSQFRAVLEKAMLDKPENWVKHYHGTPKQLALKRKYSYSDRARYYLPVPEVDKAISTLFQNTSMIPDSVLAQFMPIQFEKVKEGQLSKNPEVLVKDWVKILIDDYLFACIKKPE